ncbi:glutathione S-transferase family protein [Aquabacterium sp. OR-4]|uniref:glutathione S-transferase family protein n=1 Tax=Aquabacterium sp. OR-4 TaxID=2978127 RepID=UPI0028C9B194|nr:glutathione S-transferase family protein [Aquabacterium sp. OR-4]MDT7837407.1 glutathione S-transferase family protein [Aquabacterium sp. OR-4]
MKLYIGNKNYSSWSMRPWVLMREKGIAFDEVMLRFDSFSADSRFKKAITAVSPAGRVPALVDDDGLLVWDTLAIAEYLAERCADKALWPAERSARARARSLCAEMHSGFAALRGAFPMNIEAHLPEVGAQQLADKPAAAADLARIVTLWTEALAASGGPFLFGGYSVADAYFAPVVSRMRTYALPLPPVVAGYADRLWATAGVQAWVAEALLEADFVPEDEPYRTQR